MPQYRTRLINSEFDVTDDGVFHHSVEEASKAGVLSAFDVAKGSYEGGETCHTIEVVIIDGQRPVARHVLTIEVAGKAA